MLLVFLAAISDNGKVLALPRVRKSISKPRQAHSTFRGNKISAASVLLNLVILSEHWFEAFDAHFSFPNHSFTS